jgi:hypothetical protein
MCFLALSALFASGSLLEPDNRVASDFARVGLSFKHVSINL